MGKKGGKWSSSKHTRAGSACQNTLQSFNWVIFDTPFHAVPAYWWEGVRMPGACEAPLAQNQSRHKRCPQTIWQARAHTGVRTSKNMAPQLVPVPPGRNWYMGIPEHFQRELNPHVYYEICCFVPSLPHSCFRPSPICNSGILHLPCLFSLLSFPINPSRGKSLSLQNCPRFDHNI